MDRWHERRNHGALRRLCVSVDNPKKSVSQIISQKYVAFLSGNSVLAQGRIVMSLFILNFKPASLCPARCLAA